MKRPWTIKNAPKHARLTAVNCAAKRGITVADWLSEAITSKLTEGKHHANFGQTPPVVGQTIDAVTLLEDQTHE